MELDELRKGWKTDRSNADAVSLRNSVIEAPSAWKTMPF